MPPLRCRAAAARRAVSAPWGARCPWPDLRIDSDIADRAEGPPEPRVLRLWCHGRVSSTVAVGEMRRNGQALANAGDLAGCRPVAVPCATRERGAAPAEHPPHDRGSDGVHAPPHTHRPGAADRNPRAARVDR